MLRPIFGGQRGRGGGLGDVATLSCLRRLGLPMHLEVLYLAVQEGMSLRVLRWMVEQGAPWEENALQGILDRCNLHLAPHRT